MGQELAVTPLQLITAHAAIANGGKLIRPRLVRSDHDGSSNLVAPTVDVETPLLSSDNCNWLVQHPMKGVVERGTGKSARIPGLSMFGKTGTAQKLDPDTGTYSDHAWVLSFLCGAPAENPEVLVLVMVDEPSEKGVQYGGTVAAPTAAKILQSVMERMPQLRFDRKPQTGSERITESQKGDPIH
jgi:cell division protein FtsI/penicillin-binding protein 2